MDLAPRRIFKTLLQLTAILAGLLGAIMAVAGIRCLLIEITSGVRETQPLLGLNVSLGQALTGGAVISIASAMFLRWTARRISRRPVTPHC